MMDLGNTTNMPLGNTDAPTLRQLLDSGDRAAEPRRYHWSTREVALLKSAWPQGIAACVSVLPGRSPASIYQKAAKLDLGRAPDGGRREKRHYPSNERIDEAIRRCYLECPDMGAVKRLARTLNRPRHWVTNRARVLGLVVPRYKQPVWSDAELEILRASAGRHPTVVRRSLKAAGFRRTEGAILQKVKELHLRAEPGDDYTVAQLSEGFGVSRETVSRWVSRELLAGTRQRSMRRPLTAAPGDTAEWRFTEREVRTFIIENVGIIDFRKIDKHWLVAVLAGGQR